MEKEIHPHAFMADFVNKYLDFIKHLLEEGDVEATRVGILDASVRCGYIWEVPRMMMQCKDGTYERYCSAVQHLEAIPKTLEGFSSEGRIKKRLIQCTLREVNRGIAELEFILQGDKIYEELRQKEVV